MYRRISAVITVSKFIVSIILAVLTNIVFAQRCFSTGQMITDTIVSEALKGNRLGDPHTRNMIIYLPPSYAYSDKMYSVIYLLHGHGGDDRSFVDELGEELVIFLVDGMIEHGLIKEVLIVMPNAKSKYGGSYYLNSELTGNYEDYIVYELVDYIDSEYRTICDRNGRAIAGASMGGYGSMTLAMKHPEVFSSVVSLSPPLGFDAISEVMIPEVIKENSNGMAGPGPDSGQFTSYMYSLSAALSPNLDNPPFFVDLPFEYPTGEVVEPVRQRWLEGDPLTMLSTYGSSLMQMKGIYIDVGDEDLPGFEAATDAFHEKLMEMGVTHEYNVYHGGHEDRVVERATSLLIFLSDLLFDPMVPSAVVYAYGLPVSWGGIKRR